MSHKKPDSQPSNDEQVLIDRVDAMMDIKRTDAAPTPAVAQTSAASQPIDIFKGLKLAPPVEDIVETDPEPKSEPEAQQEPSAPKLSDEQENNSEPEEIPVPVKIELEPEVKPAHKAKKQTAAAKPQPVIDKEPVAKAADTTQQKSSSTLKISVIDDDETDKAVDDIIIAEGDDLLAAEDIAGTVAPTVKQQKKGFGKLFE
ncbi:MAG: hypothetical protein QFB86_03010 [Patescibacteria group bacterium]|nr:hypothetical protein [Patescibacteria group bacterium]